MSNPSFNLSPSVDVFLRRQDELLFRLREHADKTVFIWGAGKNGQMVARLLMGTELKVGGFFDIKADREVLGLPVLPEPERPRPDQFIVIAMNDPRSVVNRIQTLCRENNTPYVHAVNADGEVGAALLGGRKTLKDFHNIHKGERCFVAGNGPSLNRIDMSKLDGELVFGSNRCFIGFEKWGVRFPYWAVEDPEVGGWQASEWKKLRGITKFVPEHMKYHVEPDDPDVCRINQMRIDYETTSPLFSIYPEMLFSGRTVTYLLLQLAAIMGCSPIYLIGVDFYFTQTGTRQEKNGSIWRQLEEDQNHFDPNYIPTGRYLAKPHWDLQKRAFESAKNAAEYYEFNIYNATPGSKLDVFECVDYEALF